MEDHSKTDDFLDVGTPKTKPLGGGDQKSQMKKLFEIGFKSDLTILVGFKKEPFEAHRLILEAQSEKLKEMIEKLSPGNYLEIIDCDPDIFRMFLRHLYTGDSGAGMEEALPLHKIASDFQVPDLMSQCSDLLKGDLNDHNVTIIFQQAMEFEREELIQTTLDYICKNAWKILELDGYLELRLESFYEILKRDDLKARNELQVVKAVLRWTDVQCKSQNLPLEPKNVANKNMRKVMNKLLWLLRLPVISLVEFKVNPEAKRIMGMLTLAENVQLVCCISVPKPDRVNIGTEMFNDVPREYYDGGHALEVDRFVQRYKTIMHHYFKEEKFELMANKDILLQGLKLCSETFKASGEGGCNWSIIYVEVSVKDLKGGTIHHQFKGRNELIKIGGVFGFDQLVKLEADQWHSIEVNFTGPVDVFKAEPDLGEKCVETKYKLMIGPDYVDVQISLKKEDDMIEDSLRSFRRPEGSGPVDVPLAQGLIAGLTFQRVLSTPTTIELGPSNKVPLYRYLNGETGDHFYTTDFAELGEGKNGYLEQGIECHVFLNPETGSVPLYRYRSNSQSGNVDHFYQTTWAKIEGYACEGIEGYIFPSPVTGTVPLYRYYIGCSGDHFYTTEWLGTKGYVFEGITGYVYAA